MQTKLHLGVFDRKIYLFARDKDRVKYMIKKGCVDVKPLTVSHLGAVHVDVKPSGKWVFSIVVPHNSTQATLAHECVHVADLIMDYVGIPTGRKNTEVRAYMVSHLMDQLAALKWGIDVKSGR